MYMNSHPLYQTAQALKSGNKGLIKYIEESCEGLDSIDPELQAFLPEEGRRERLLKEGEELLEKYPHPKERPPLFGVLVGIKDIFRVDGFDTKAGSMFPASLLAGREAYAVKRLKEAGALIFGKTVTTEFAYFAPGPTRNPANPNHTPGGSSSGSAAAVGAGICPLALGTQTIGSIIRPAAFCGIPGFKPSYDRISRDGLIDFSPSIDNIGIFTQDLEGIELAAQTLCQDWQAELDDARLKRLPVLGVPEGPYLEQASLESLDIFRKQLEGLQDKGYIIKHIELFQDINEINERHNRLIFGEMARLHEGWYSAYSELYRPQTKEVILFGKNITEQEIEKCKKESSQLREFLARIMKENSVDIWITPSAIGPAPLGIETTGSPLMNLPWTQAGVPALTIPAGKAKNGLPLGMQFIADYMDDEILLTWAYGLEGAIKHGL